MSTTFTPARSRALTCVATPDGTLAPIGPGRHWGEESAWPFATVSARLLGHLDRAGRRRGPKALEQFVASVWLRYWAWQLRRAMRLLLRSLDDRVLNDLGLHRSEIEAVVGAIDWRRLRG